MKAKIKQKKKKDTGTGFGGPLNQKAPKSRRAATAKKASSGSS